DGKEEIRRQDFSQNSVVEYKAKILERLEERDSFRFAHPGFRIEEEDDEEVDERGDGGEEKRPRTREPLGIGELSAKPGACDKPESADADEDAKRFAPKLRLRQIGGGRLGKGEVAGTKAGDEPA